MTKRDMQICTSGGNNKIRDKASGANGPGSKSIMSYLDLLHREIDLINESHPLSTVYIGGGTPSILSVSQIAQLLNHLKNHFGFQDGAEITLEIDPASFTRFSLEGYLDAGINRISLGAQSFDNKVLFELYYQLVMFYLQLAVLGLAVVNSLIFMYMDYIKLMKLWDQLEEIIL